MENAAKALIIAGGILFAIMILSLIVYMSTSTTRMVEAQEEKKQVEELTAFNKEYEAYNKTRMYGTDIITVMKKAIDYNEKVEEETKKIKIDVETTTTFETVKQITTISGNNKETRTKETIDNEYSLKPAGTYSIDNSELQKFLKQSVNDYYDESSTQSTKIYIYSALSAFKKSIFKCSEVKYDDNGRISYMKFEELNNFKDF